MPCPEPRPRDRGREPYFPLVAASVPAPAVGNGLELEGSALPPGSAPLPTRQDLFQPA